MKYLDKGKLNNRAICLILNVTLFQLSWSLAYCHPCKIISVVARTRTATFCPRILFLGLCAILLWLNDFQDSCQLSFASAAKYFLKMWACEWRMPKTSHSLPAACSDTPVLQCDNSLLFITSCKAWMEQRYYIQLSLFRNIVFAYFIMALFMCLWPNIHFRHQNIQKNQVFFFLS